MAVSFSLTKKELFAVSADMYVCFVEQDFKPDVLAEHKNLFPALFEYLKAHNFTGKAQTLVSVPVTYNNKLITLVIVGLGKRTNKKLLLELYRRALALAIRAAQKNSSAKCALTLPVAAAFDVDDQTLIQNTAIIAHMTDYVFDTFKKVEPARVALTLILCATTHDIKSCETALAHGTIIGTAVNDARQWVNLPANIMRPEELAAQARELAREHKLHCRVFSEQEITDMGMGGLAAVSKGSEQECCLIVLEYKTKANNAPMLGLVGKGITFDSGGLSLKPAQSMETMKEDMAGAAAVIATMRALAQLQPSVNVVAIMPLAENLPSGVAAKPGDIVRMYNGKTVEIKNTDAEGRLILADALAYMVKHHKPVALVDIATLTGACEHALGPFFTGLLSEHDELAERVARAGKYTGEQVWRLPLTDDYKKTMDSPVADLCNQAKPGYFAGASTAAVFLQQFVGDTPWVHLDIAGTSFNVPDIPYYSRETATGVGVRLLVEFVSTWKTIK